VTGIHCCCWLLKHLIDSCRTTLLTVLLLVLTVLLTLLLLFMQATIPSDIHCNGMCVFAFTRHYYYCFANLCLLLLTGIWLLLLLLVQLMILVFALLPTWRRCRWQADDDDGGRTRLLLLERDVAANARHLGPFVMCPLFDVMTVNKRNVCVCCCDIWWYWNIPHWRHFKTTLLTIFYNIFFFIYVSILYYWLKNMKLYWTRSYSEDGNMWKMVLILI
jgi:hypothetical protein